MIKGSIEEYIKEQEEKGQLDPNCKTCQSHFYPEIKRGVEIWQIFAPRHRAMDHCHSGKYNHCSCDSCF